MLLQIGMCITLLHVPMCPLFRNINLHLLQIRLMNGDIENHEDRIKLILFLRTDHVCYEFKINFQFAQSIFL